MSEERQTGTVKWFSRVKGYGFITPDGDVLKLEYDARTLEVLELKGRHRKQRDRDTED